ncbi:metallophosphoesterase [Candidatus Saccharibacteria bacterium]|nr:metallophosphoesterase [Candidatus Saccharibacteria bacterium]
MRTMKIHVTGYEMKSPEILEPTRVMAISDVHENSRMFAGITALVRDTRPDYLCLVGDTLDHSGSDGASVIEWLKDLAKLTKVVITIGNHEMVALGRGFFGMFRRPQVRENHEFYKTVEGIKNCALLKEQFSVYEATPWLTFSALNMPENWYQRGLEDQKEFDAAVAAIPKNALQKKNYNIMLSHSPGGFLMGGRLRTKEAVPILDKVDLVLSGHHHAGLVPLALRKLMAKRGFFGPRYLVGQPHAYGMWERDGRYLILSGGVTKFAESSGVGGLGHWLNKRFKPEAEDIWLLPDVGKGANRNGKRVKQGK